MNEYIGNYKTVKALEANAESLLCKKNVVGVAAGRKHINGVRQSEHAILVLVEKKEAVSALSAEDFVPPHVERAGEVVKTDVIEIGKIVAEASTRNRDRERPLVGGVSVGHYQVTAGTLGCFVEREGEVFILSNNHVLANSNEADIGDPIWQPGDADGGNSNDVVAVLSDFVPIDFNRTNLVDAALAKVLVEQEDDEQEREPVDEIPLEPPEPQPPVEPDWFGRLMRFVENLFRRLRNRASVELEQQVLFDIASIEHKGHVQHMKKFGDVNPYRLVPATEGTDFLTEVRDIDATGGILRVSVGDKVQKTGRTTGYTVGEVIGTDAIVNVDFGNGRVARFEDQLLLTNMSEGGDSGSVIFTEGGDVAGLLFAGSNTVTIANKIEHVIDLLEIDDVLVTPGR